MAGLGRTRWLLIVAGLVAAAQLIPGSPVAGAADQGRACEESRIAVAIAPGRPASYEVHSRLCLPPSRQPSTVQLLVHGLTYDSRYWDFRGPEGSGDRYSYTSAATGAGFATLAIDRIGAGRSSRPPGTSVTIDSNAYVVHQVVQALRSGQVRGPRGTVGFGKVVLVGHSYGSWTSWYEASRYKDVDAVIFSGVSHNNRVDSPLLLLPKLLQPAFLDPTLAGRGHDPTYLTTIPGARYEAFHAPGRTEHAVRTADERIKSTVTATEIYNFPLILRHPLDITVPVLLANGTGDPLFCGGPALGAADCSSASALVASERPYLGPNVPCVEGYVLPGSGHAMNLMPNAQRWFAASQRFVTERIGAGPGPGSGCAA